MSFEDETPYTYLSKEQEEYLAKNPHVCAYLGALQEGYSPREIEKRFKINRKSTNKYLLALDKWEIIEYGKNLNVRVKIHNFINLENAPALRETFYTFMLSSATEYFLKKIRNPGDAYIKMTFFKLTKRTYVQFKEEMDRLYEKYLVSSSYESRLHSDAKLEKISFVALADQ